MVKPLMLSGGAEFTPESNALDRAMLRQSSERVPIVVIVPVAATDNPRKVVKPGVRYFDSLGARAGYAMVVDAQTADMGGQAAEVERANVIYLPDGSPLDAVNGLRGTHALAKMLTAWHSGAVLAGVAAGAMALCEYYWDSGNWETGLGLLTGITVLPHHEIVSARFSPERLRRDLPVNTVILGLDDATGVLINGAQVRVVGPGVVTIYRSDTETDYTDGQSFALDKSVIPSPPAT